jgi:UDP:flavonoid glycosyltransferase YjiC (YdhE family)
MNITVTSHGARGDVQPYLALAVGLQQAGHQVTLATSHDYAEMTRLCVLARQRWARESVPRTASLVP